MTATSTSRRYRWQVAEPWDGAEELARHLRTGTLIAQLLHNRGIDDADAARAYLSPKLADLHDPEQLGGTAAAAERIARAVRDGEPITLYGDYDVDGMTGVAILQRGLTMIGAKVDYYIPHRVEEGYGLNTGAIDALADRVRHVVQSAFNGRRIVIFSGGAAKGREGVLEEIKGIAEGGGFGSIIGRNSFQRQKGEAIELLHEVMDIYANA